MNERNRFPEHMTKLYLMAICGTGMGSLAGLLKEKGFEVSGSDQGVYPPMSDELQKNGIRVHSPYAGENLKAEAPDLVIVGNALSKTNPEVTYLLEQTNIPYISMPQALHHFFLSNKEVIVVSGTHGKTTTSSLMAFLLTELGQDPSFLIGGVTLNFSSNFQIGQGKYFVIEGDEYDTAFFDKGPKFLHYNPRHVIMTSLEFDHADIYRDLDHVVESFVKLSALIPKNGSLHYNDSYPALARVLPSCQAKFIRAYGTQSSDWQVSDFTPNADGADFTITKAGNLPLMIHSPLPGLYNALNTASCFSVLDHLGLDITTAAKVMPKFKGVKRRQEVLFQNDDFALIDDFAHHPTAVAETITAIREKYPLRKLIAVFEPRSNSSKRDIFQEAYANSFMAADETVLANVFMPEKIKDGAILNVSALTETLRQRGKVAYNFATTEEIVSHLSAHSDIPKVVLVMSNGSFDGLTGKTIKAYGTTP